MVRGQGWLDARSCPSVLMAHNSSYEGVMDDMDWSEMQRLLDETVAVLAERESKCRAALMVASEAGDLGAVQNLVPHLQNLVPYSGAWGRAILSDAFKRACRRGRLAVAQWLAMGDQGGVDVHVDRDTPFEHACSHEHLAVARWLLTLEPETYVWPRCISKLKQWTAARDGWMRAVAQAW